ncbi:MAG: anti-sigma factor [Actinomycetota bacterium]|nr:anti-sigma factor [Actinomycetota bacterium]
MSTNLDIHHLAAAYALDALDARERAVFEAHYPACVICSHDVREFRATLAAMGEASATPPPADLRARLMQEIGETRQLSPLLPGPVAHLAARRRPSALVLAAAAAVLLLIGLASFAFGRSSNDDRTFADALDHVLAQPDARLIELTATDGTGGRVQLAWSATAHQAALLADGLAPAGEGMAYELWLIDAGGPAPMRLLDPAADGSLRRTLTVDGTPVQWGITIEPRGGSPAPTGDVIFLGAA